LSYVKHKERITATLTTKTTPDITSTPKHEESISGTRDSRGCDDCTDYTTKMLMD
jgi:hypothetical protein